MLASAMISSLGMCAYRSSSPLLVARIRPCAFEINVSPLHSQGLRDTRASQIHKTGKCREIGLLGGCHEACTHSQLAGSFCLSLSLEALDPNMLAKFVLSGVIDNRLRRDNGLPVAGCWPSVWVKRNRRRPNGAGRDFPTAYLSNSPQSCEESGRISLLVYKA